MNTLLNPDLAYLALLGGLLMGMMAFIVPGTGLMEVLAVFLLGAAGYGLVEFGLHGWALAGIGLGLGLLFYASRRRQDAWWLGGIFVLALSAGFLYPGAHLPIILSGGLLFSLLMWFMHHQLQNDNALPADMPIETVIGQIGEAKSEIYHEGSVQVGGQLWSARSDTPIPAGSAVRVLEAEGFVLTVTAVEEEPPTH